MLKDVVAVEAVGDYCLRLRFEDGVEGEVDLSTVVPFEGVFAALRDPTIFEAVLINPELGTICWQNGADLDPDVLLRSGPGRTGAGPARAERRVHRLMEG